MPRFFVVLVFVFSLVVSVSNASQDRRAFSFTYQTTIKELNKSDGAVHVFIPLAVENDHQQIIDEKIVASITGQIEVEEAYGNRYWHGEAKEADGDISITVTTVVQRIASVDAKVKVSRALNAQEKAELARYLNPNAKVVVGHPILNPILAEIKAAALSENPADISRAIYDWVVDNVEYKKIGDGWGNGDTFWACNERYGNCTDFHALFISLARSENIPARFEIGFPVPTDRNAGEIGGYHCWVQFYLPNVGWFPIDASEAFKHPEKREYLYGAHPEDRIHFSTGRDIRLGKSHKDKPLNYFVYPYVEVNGKAFTGIVEKIFSYQAIN